MLSLRIYELRNKQGLSQAQIAQHLKITHQAYSLYETGKRQMNYETLCLLADYHEVSTDYLLGRQEALPSFLSEHERSVIERYRTLDNHARDTVDNALDFECSRATKEKEKKKAM